ncbi:hypothetical protein BTR22_18365 [Alkalihalophilus pseudofirmus]|uniref:class F sortase n=1 Tax=Alkalihalophilus pseudofirmus TaxID=79885 RepID=UPI000952E223|nr:hypothetical protein BTR22_18365 [Alkalihalophilus pseudofirmus]
MKIWLTSFSVFILIMLGCQPSQSNAAESLTGSKPEFIKIPALDIQAEIAPFGLRNYEQIPPDGEKVFWYEDGVNPGGPGNAVLAGHFDDYVGPAVFYHLHELKTGDYIYIVTENDYILTYRVEDVETYKRAEAPVKSIFYGSGKSKLNLVTCSGYYSKKEKTHSHRTVVTAALKGKSYPYQPITEPPL